MRNLPFNEVVSDVTSKFFKIKKSDYLKDGKYLILDQGKRHIAGYTNDDKLINNDFKPIIVFGDHTRIFKFESSPIALGADGAKALWVDSSVAYNKYVFAFLKSIKIKDAGYSRHFKFLKKIKIPIPFDGDIPNIDEQVRIATLLNHIESMIANRRENLKELDDFMKSVFLEMFGDPVKNDKGWNKKKGDSLCSLITVGVVVKPASYYVDKGVVALRSQNIRENRIDLENGLVYFSEKNSNGVLKKSVLKANDVIIVRTGKPGTAAVIPPSLEGVNCIDVIISRPNMDIVNPYYLVFFYNSQGGKRIVGAAKRGQIQQHFNVKSAKESLIPLPPIEMQNKFSLIVEKIESIKNKCQLSLNELLELYGAISQKAFKGELDLSRVPLPVIEIEEW